MGVAADPEWMGHAVEVVEIVALATVAGWVSVRVLHAEQSSWALTLLTGLIGVYAGPRLMALTPWWFGPFVGDVPLVPAFLSALLAAALLKLVGLGAAVSRR